MGNATTNDDFGAVQAPLDGFMALVFTDLEGSSALSEKFGGAFEVQREAHFEILRAELDALDGYEVETAGDSLFVVFPEVSRAALWSLRAQNALQNHEWPEDIGEIKVRIGLHVGIPFVSRDKKSGSWTFRGPVTNRTARLMGVGHGGQIVVSQQAADLLLPSAEAFDLRELGVYRLKGMGDETIWQLSAPGLRQEFPELTAIPARRHNLPLAITPFFGHTVGLDRWRALLLKPTTRLLTLCAFGGMGKTRSALQLGENCALDFPDGVWWVALENVRSRDAMLAQIAETLPFEIQARKPVLEQLQHHLAEKSLLLILDNTEQIEEAAQVVKALVESGPRLKILVTTRHALQLQCETVREVPPLSVAESARLFCARAAALGHTYAVDDPIIRNIVDTVEGVPLALELSASLIGVLSPSQILGRLNNQLKLLKSRSPDLPDRQRALRATMDWSFEMLESQDQEIFARLSVFAGGFELEDAEAVTGLEDIFFSIQELHHRSLLRAQSDESGLHKRYAMLESVRTYAREQLEQDPVQSRNVWGQHARHYNAKMADFAAKMRSRDEAEALKAASAEFDNARVALRFLAGENPLQMAQLALVYGRVLQRAGLLKEAGERFQSGLDALGSEAKDSDLYASLRLERAGAYLDLNDYEPARDLAEQAYSHFEAEQNARGLAESHYLLGLIALRTWQQDETARSHFEASLGFFEGIEKAMVLNALGLYARQISDNERAFADFNAALSLYRANNYPRGAADALTNLGVLAQESNDLATARQRYREALELEMDSGAQSGLARALSNVGEIESLLENWESAAQILAAATHLFDRSGSPLRDYSFDLLQTSASALNREPQEFLNESRDKSMKELAEAAQETR